MAHILILALSVTSCIVVFRVTLVTYPGWFCSTFHAEIPVVVVEAKSGLLNFRSPDCATLCYKFHEVRVNRCFQNKTALKCAKKSRKLIQAVGSSQTYLHAVASFLAHPVQRLTIMAHKKRAKWRVA